MSVLPSWQPGDPDHTLPGEVDEESITQRVNRLLRPRHNTSGEWPLAPSLWQEPESQEEFEKNKRQKGE